jgi:hypothetical protein
MDRLRLVVFLAIAISIILPATALAQYTSPNYQSNEIFFGSGGDVDSSSPNYQAQSSIGALGVGNFSSTTYQAFAGFLTPNEPFLELGIDTSLVNLGTLDASSTKTGTANFHVRAYIDSGYSVQTMSQTPKYTSGTQTHFLTNMASQGSSTAGTEQFGINLKHNTSPATFGTDPSPQPDGTFATGIAAPGYDTANQYKYNVNDTIVRTPSGSSGWGQTNYTIAYIANINQLTPAGSYTMIHDLVVIATY